VVSHVVSLSVSVTKLPKVVVELHVTVEVSNPVKVPAAGSVIDFKTDTEEDKT
jgi:hypothetical protein